MKNHLLILFLCLPVFVQAQDSLTCRLVKADIFFEKREYINAIDFYTRCLKSKNKKDTPYQKHVLQRLGDCHRILNNNQEAETFYNKAIQDNEPSDSTLFYYAQVLKKNQHYEAAKQQFSFLLERYPDSLLLQSFYSSCDSAIKWSIEKTVYQVSAIEKINSEYSDITAVPYHLGIVFSSNREAVIMKRKTKESNVPYYNLYLALTDSLNQPQNIRRFSSAVNSSQHETAPFFSHYDEVLYYTSNTLDKDNVSRLKLYSIEYENNKWKHNQRFFLNDSLYSFAHASIDNTERMFFFASDLPGGYGGTDIYVCFKIEEQWSDPINLGPVINTAGNELYPFYHDSGSLYFSSNFHQGLGGYDIYEAFQKKGDWTSVINLKMPINSSDDDFGIYFDEDKKTGYFSSNRPGGKGAEDIYKIERQ